MSDVEGFTEVFSWRPPSLRHLSPRLSASFNQRGQRRGTHSSPTKKSPRKQPLAVPLRKSKRAGSTPQSTPRKRKLPATPTQTDPILAVKRRRKGNNSSSQPSTPLPPRVATRSARLAEENVDSDDEEKKEKKESDDPMEIDKEEMSESLVVDSPSRRTSSRLRAISGKKAKSGKRKEESTGSRSVNQGLQEDEKEEKSERDGDVMSQEIVDSRETALFKSGDDDGNNPDSGAEVSFISTYQSVSLTQSQVLLIFISLFIYLQQSQSLPSFSSTLSSDPAAAPEDPFDFIEMRDKFHVLEKIGEGGSASPSSSCFPHSSFISSRLNTAMVFFLSSHRRHLLRCVQGSLPQASSYSRRSQKNPSHFITATDRERDSLYEGAEREGVCTPCFPLFILFSSRLSCVSCCMLRRPHVSSS